jgi:3'-5' exoribonuclease
MLDSRTSRAVLRRAGFQLAIDRPLKMPKTYVSEIKPNQEIAAQFVVAERELRTARNGSPFLALKLADRTGEIAGRMWERAVEAAELVKPKDVALVKGRSEVYREELQLQVAEITPVAAGAFDPSDFLRATAADTEALFEQLKKMLGGVGSRPLFQLCGLFLADRDLMVRFKLAPAAKAMHHACLGGLIEHTVSVMGVILRICDHYPELDRDLLLVGAFLHDIGKIEEFVYDIQIDYSDAGRLLGHLVIGVRILDEKIRGLRGFPADKAILLKHLILSHHGEAEFGAVRLPMNREAFALHFADDLDAKMNYLGRLLSDPGAAGSESWTKYQSLFERHFFRGFSRPPHEPLSGSGAPPPEEAGPPQLSIWSTGGRKQ